jgi:hypothetical protein
MTQGELKNNEEYNSIYFKIDNGITVPLTMRFTESESKVDLSTVILHE